MHPACHWPSFYIKCTNKWISTAYILCCFPELVAFDVFCAIRMYENTKFFILILISCVSGYKLSEYEPVSNSSSDISESSTIVDRLSSDDGHTTYEAWKNAQNYVYPKLYKTTEPNGHIKSSRNITLDDVGSETIFTKLDQSLIESKHTNIDGGSSENGLHLINLLPTGGNNGLSNILQLIDPLFLMAVLGFVVYIVNAVLCLVDKLHLSRLLGSSVSPVFYNNYRRQQEASTFPSFDANQNFLRDLERIFRLAIELYERKI